MAIDTRAKRLSMLDFCSPFPGLPDPSGSVDEPARSTFLHLYSGITLATEIVSDVLDTLLRPVSAAMTRSMIRPLIR